MKQRVMIAFSLLCDPQVIILDEPTTALDVITQDFIFSFSNGLMKRWALRCSFYHDIAIVSKYADYIGVMYGGSLMEYGEVEAVFEARNHPTLWGSLIRHPLFMAPLIT